MYQGLLKLELRTLTRCGMCYRLEAMRGLLDQITLMNIVVDLTG